MNLNPAHPLEPLLTSSFVCRPATPTVTSTQAREIEFQKLKQRIHTEIVGSLDLVSELTDEQIRQQLGPFVDSCLQESRTVVEPLWRQRLDKELPFELFGLGPLEQLMRDPTISDILVNHQHQVFIERGGRLETSDIVFADQEHLLRIIQRIASLVGRRIDEVCPMVDARLADGSRVNAIIPPLALDGPKLSIRRFGRNFLTLDSLVVNGTLTESMAEFLASAVRARVSMLISGGTGSGKTTLLNALSSAISPDQRIVTIEDSAELLLNHPHVARLETRPANSEGSGQYTQRDLVRNSLRMRPDRIIVGEIRGAEALDMLQAMNTGHDGSLTTIHANDTRDAIARLEMMVAMTGLELPTRVVRSYIASGIEVVVQLARLASGERRVLRISELENSTDGEIVLHDLFSETSNRTAIVKTDYPPRCMFKINRMEAPSAHPSGGSCPGSAERGEA